MTEVRRWHAIDAPHRPIAEWVADLETGVCTACHQPARRGDRRWWHVNGDACWRQPRPRWPQPATRRQFRGD